MYWVNGSCGVVQLAAGWQSSYNTELLVFTPVNTYKGDDTRKLSDNTASFQNNDAKIFEAAVAIRQELLAYIVGHWQ